VAKTFPASPFLLHVKLRMFVLTVAH